MTFAAPFGAVIRGVFDTLSGLTFLLRDDFTTDESAPLASPQACDPGPGTLTYVQTDGQFSRSGGRLQIPAGSGAAFGSLGFYDSTAYARAAGLSILSKLQYTTTATGALSQIAAAVFKTNTNLNPAAAGGNRYGITISIISNNELFSLEAGLAAQRIVAVAPNTDYSVAAVLRSSGLFTLVKGGIYTDWTLYWVGVTGSDSPLYAQEASVGSQGSMDTWRVSYLPAPFDSDYGIVYQRFQGTVAAGTSFVHPADCLLEYTVTTLPASGTIDVEFHELNTDNKHWLRISSTGAVQLWERIAGVDTSLGGPVAAAVTSGGRVQIYTRDQRIVVTTNEVRRITATTASNTLKTYTQGVLVSLGSGGVVSNLNVWPVSIVGAAGAVLDEAMAA